MVFVELIKFIVKIITAGSVIIIQNMAICILFLFGLFYLPWHLKFLLLSVYISGIFFIYLDGKFIRYLFKTLFSFVEPILFKHNKYINVPNHPSNSKVLVCVHPHGPFLTHFAHVFHHSIFDNFLLLVHEGLIYLPFANWFIKFLNYQPISNNNFKRHMKKGCNICILPGGQTDMALYEHEEHHTYLSDRKGFIKYALQHNYKLQPCYIFSESSTFSTYNPFSKRLRLKMLSTRNYILNSLIYFTTFGIGSYPFVPCDTNQMTAFGDIIQLPLISNPTNEEIDHWHRLYVDGLTKTFNDNIGAWVKIHPQIKSKKLVIH